jgi:predicted DNA-binding protein
MCNRQKSATLAVPMTPEDRERLKEKAEHIGLSPATYARVLIKRELNASEPVAA